MTIALSGVGTTFFTQGAALVGIFMSAAWTTAKLSVEASPDGINWFTAKNTTLEQAQAEAGIFIPIPTIDTVFAPFLRLSSVDATGALVVQAAARTLTLVTKRYLGGSS